MEGFNPCQTPIDEFALKKQGKRKRRKGYRSRSMRSQTKLSGTQKFSRVDKDIGTGRFSFLNNHSKNAVNGCVKFMQNEDNIKNEETKRRDEDHELENEEIGMMFDVHYSINKAKRWEMVEDVKRGSKENIFGVKCRSCKEGWYYRDGNKNKKTVYDDKKLTEMYLKKKEKKIEKGKLQLQLSNSQRRKEKMLKELKNVGSRKWKKEKSKKKK